MKRILIVLLSLLLLPPSLWAEAKKRTEKKLDSLLVYGQGFMFSVKEPSGWVGDIENAKKLSANIIFYPVSQRYETAQTIIRVLIVSKVDENTQGDLSHDMQEYLAQYPGVKFEKITITHPTYRVFPKLFVVPGEFYEYVTYINPGPQKKLMFSVSMNKQKMEAATSDFDAYQKIIASLKLF
jgi:hypothetical protein